VRITAASLLTGLLIGAVGGAFRLLLSKADDLRYALVVWAHAWPYLGWLVPVALGTLGAVVAHWLVTKFAPEAEGSGIQRVEATFAGEVTPARHPLVILPVKFLGGLLASVPDSRLVARGRQCKWAPHYRLWLRAFC
jgi:CIC family chloride channel protein